MNHFQKGNALFLILIAVALFAALSYAITQSSRGGGTIGKEQTLISAAQITGYPAAVRSAVTRMIITGSAASAIDFDPSSTGSNAVFDTAGGGVIYQAPPANIAHAGGWFFGTTHDGNYIKDIGTNTDFTGQDSIAYLQGLSLSICQQIDKTLGLGSTVVDNVDALDELGFNGQNVPQTYGAGAVIDAYPGEPFGCVFDLSGTAYYIYYHAIIEQ